MLRDYYEIIEYDLKPRPVVMENIEKVITVVILPMVAPCISAHIVKIGNLSLSVAQSFLSYLWQ